ncbi:50S ribosomal protein L22 [Sulfolobus tengchongensis]|uniref:Large ribosomal subunit protein uL22 n=1 Tax=Sulfolobus tengchongensis TaxID=207809 RepID=A0AAX4L1F9_9CREN
MGSWSYPQLNVDELKIAKAVIRDVPVSIKDLYNVCKSIRGMYLSDAKDFLNRVLEEKEALPFWRYNKGASHKSNISAKWKVKAGRYPKKAIKHVLKLLENAEANATNKGLDVNKLVIRHIAAHKSIILKRYMPRAFGRATAKYRRTANVEVILEEVE